MSWTNPPQRPPGQPPAGPPFPPAAAPPTSAARLFGGPEAWLHALVAVVAAFAAMAFTAWLALWLLGAGDLGGGTMPALVAAAVALAVGGKVDLKGAENTGDQGILGSILGDVSVAEAGGEVDLLMFGVGLVGALVLGWLFLRPLRYRLVIGADELIAHMARIAVFTAAALGACVALGSHELPIGEAIPQVDAAELMGIFNLGAAAEFTTDAPTTLGFGLLWTVLVMVVALAVSARGPLPRLWLRYRDVLRPPVAGVMAVFLGAVVLGIIGTPFVAAEAPGPKRMIGGMLLALPNVMWLLVTLGLGVEWKSSGGGDFSFGLPGPLGRLLNESGSQDMPITIGRLAELDGRAWWVPVVSAILLLFGGTVAALRSPAHVKLHQHAWRFAVAFAVAAVIAAVIAQIHLKVAIQVLGGVAEPGGEVSLHADYLMTAGFGALWGACAGLLGGALAAWIRAVQADRRTAPPARPAAPLPGPWPGPQPGHRPPPGPGTPSYGPGGPSAYNPRNDVPPGGSPPYPPPNGPRGPYGP